MTDIATLTPAAAWREMVEGNQRFVAGSPAHPHQDVERRASLAGGQEPHAVLFGCSDSRLAAEIIFDTGLGDLFVIRNAGQVVSDSVVASLEYAVEVLRTPLVVVLAHDSCGAVGAAIGAHTGEGGVLPPRIAAHVAPVEPSVAAVEARTPEGSPIDPHEVGVEHLRATVRAIVEQSELVSAAVADGRLAVVGANYRLREGLVDEALVIGQV